MICVRCRCGWELQLPDSLLGQGTLCPGCQQPINLLGLNGVGHDAAGGDVSVSGDGHVIDLPFRLVIEKGPSGIGEQFAFGETGTIEVGKMPGKDVRLIGTRVSRAHCRLTSSGDGWTVEDLNSTNGTLVNDQPIQRQKLYLGDRLQVGEFELLFEMPIENAPGISDVSLEVDGAPESPAHGEVIEFVAPQTASTASGISRAPPVLPAYAQRLAVVEPKVVKSRKAGPGPTCPSCKQVLEADAKICVACGIQIPTGRPLVTSREVDMNNIQAQADNWVRAVSFFMPFGLFPVASEAFATRSAWMTPIIAGLTTVISIVFYITVLMPFDHDEHAPNRGLNLMLWCGVDQWKIKTAEIAQKYPEDANEIRMAEQESRDRYNRGTFHPYQLLTNIFLHSGLMHLVGNMVFFLVFGLRVNQLVGDLKMAILYPILGIGASLAHYFSEINGRFIPALGASGAIMGLAGMYIVLFPVQRVHTLFWIRLFWRLPCFYRIFALRGIWLLVVWVGFNDVLIPALTGGHDGVAHWAHLGGFLFGAVIGLLLLITRLVNAHGGDLLNVMLGRHAWPLVGRPSQRADVLFSNALGKVKVVG